MVENSNDIPSWTIEKESSEISILITGTINEDFPYENIIADLEEPITLPINLQLKGVKRMNSMGIREWFNFLSAISTSSKIIYSECSLTFTEIICQVEDLWKGHECYVHSCYLPIYCLKCTKEFDYLVVLSELVVEDEEISVDDNPQQAECPICNELRLIEYWTIEDIVSAQNE